MEIVLEALPIKLLQLLQLLLKKIKETSASLLNAIRALLSQNLPIYSKFSAVKEKGNKASVEESRSGNVQFKGLLTGFKESILEPLQEKLLQLFLKMEPWLRAMWTKVAWFLAGKLEEFLPPDVVSSNTLSNWVQFFMAVALIRVAFLLTYFLLRIMRKFTVTAAKMMKAPGRKGKHIPRAVFENDPQSYFRDLRGKAPRGRPKRWLAMGALVAGVVGAVLKSR